ncbi:hypothetical protein LJR038_002608 [Acidovorax sp. LjRoot38]|uniref:hypothetical protein n=1 Tax=Acidovorax sp. LjRoot38 TaxID=3342327 RepID=UPI003ED10B1B
MNRLPQFVLVAACLAPPFAAAQAGIATWNLGWLLDKAVHTRWVQACSAINWKTEDAIKADQQLAPEALKGLPYCDVHDGIDYRIKPKCKAAIGMALQSRPSKADSADGKCRVSPDLADWTQYERKLAVLRETFQAMDKDGVTLVGLQEVSNEAAVKTILPPGWDVITSASQAGAPAIPQHVGVAWKIGSPAPQNVQLFSELSNIGSRPLRPGLQFTRDVAGKPSDFLVVHMKAGCRSVPINNPSKDSEKEACPVLAEQVVVLERWIDDRVGKDFVVLGDFNRTLLREMEQYPRADPKRFGANMPDQVVAMATEWNDDTPKGSLIQVVPHKKNAEGKLIAGDYFCSQTTGIDHVILSATLAQRVRGSKTLEMLPVSYRLEGNSLPTDKDTVPPSDHCARFVRL